MAQIDIALPTYNKAPWLDEFMRSLTEQSHTDWRIIARDDCSSDDTAARLASWQDKLGDRLILLPDSGARNLGVIGNFNAILTRTVAPWVMTADADDVWLPSKMSATFGAALAAEKAMSPATPIAVCSDAMVVDGDSRLVASSYWRWCRMNPELAISLPKTAMESVALGSTMVVNRALLDLALPIPTGASYQDWWLAMAAVAFGRLIPLPIQTILYRRHGANLTAGPYGASMLGALSRTLGEPAAAGRRIQSLILQAATQAEAFAKRYRDQLDNSDLSALDALVSLSKMAPVARRLALARHGLWFGSPLKNTALLALI